MLDGAVALAEDVVGDARCACRALATRRASRLDWAVAQAKVVGVRRAEEGERKREKERERNISFSTSFISHSRCQNFIEIRPD